MDEDRLSAEEYLIFKQSLDEITPPEQEPVSYTGNGTAGRETDVRPTGFVFQMPPQLDIDVMVAYLLLKVKQRDWHGVAGAANDIREMEAYLSSMPTLTVVPKEKNT